MLLRRARRRTRQPSRSITSCGRCKGKTNTVYLLGSVHFLQPERAAARGHRRRVPRRRSAAHGDRHGRSRSRCSCNRSRWSSACCRTARRCEQQLGPTTYAQGRSDDARDVGIDPALLNRFQPWLARMTLVQLQLMKMGLDPQLGVEQRLHARARPRRQERSRPGNDARAARDAGAACRTKQQREFLLYSVEDAERWRAKSTSCSPPGAAATATRWRSCWRKASTNTRTCTVR